MKIRIIHQVTKLMPKVKNWFDWLDQSDAEQVQWAIRYLAPKVNKNFTDIEFHDFVNTVNVSINASPRHQGFKELRDAMKGAWISRLNKNKKDRVACSYILKVETDRQLKIIAKMHNKHQNQIIEILINEAHSETNNLIEEFKRDLKEIKKHKSIIKPAKKTLLELENFQLENENHQLKLKIEFIDEKIKNLILSEIKNRFILKTIDMEDYKFTDMEDTDIIERNENALKRLDQEVQSHIQLDLLEAQSKKNSESE
jgi:hypothetical protein